MQRSKNGQGEKRKEGQKGQKGQERKERWFSFCLPSYHRIQVKFLIQYKKRLDWKSIIFFNNI